MRLRRKNKTGRISSLVLAVSIFLFGCRGTPDFEMLGLRTNETEGSADETAAEHADQQADSIGLVENRSELSGEAQEEAHEIQQPALAVFVCGAVNLPGVYLFPDGARVCDAVEAAGGFAPEADTEWANQARPLEDGQKLKILTVEETDALRSAGMSDELNSGNTAGDSADGKINLNTATREELMTLPGIGEAKAEALLQYRREHGSFLKIEEIMEISGIKEAVYRNIKDRITV